MNIRDAIGNTSLVQLHRVVPAGCGKIFARLELENPTGSVKDRMARPQAKIVTLMCDSGLKYLNTDVYKQHQPRIAQGLPQECGERSSGEVAKDIGDRP